MYTEEACSEAETLNTGNLATDTGIASTFCPQNRDWWQVVMVNETQIVTLKRLVKWCTRPCAGFPSCILVTTGFPCPGSCYSWRNAGPCDVISHHRGVGAPIAPSTVRLVNLSPLEWWLCICWLNQVSGYAGPVVHHHSGLRSISRAVRSPAGCLTRLCLVVTCSYLHTFW